jgi:hypothetical protein
MSSQPTPDLSELFTERSLWEIYRKSPSVFRNPFNRGVLIATAILLATFACFHFAWGSSSAPRLHFAEVFANWANVGISFAGTILGFLVAGFAVLFTVLRPQTLANLQQITRPDHNVSELKLLFFVFVDVFVHYVSFLFWCMAVLVFGAKDGPADWVGRIAGGWWPASPEIVCHAIFAAWGTWFVLLVLKLKSFIFNLYQCLLLGMADTLE